MFGLGLEIGIWLELNFELGVVTSIEVYMRFRLKVEVRIALTQTLTLTLNLNPNPNTIGNAVICIAVIGVVPDCTLEGKYLRCVVRVIICCTLWYSWYE